MSYTDPDIKLVSECGDRLGQTLRPGSFKVESLPWLRYVPGYTKTIDRWHADELTLFRGQLDMARERLVGGPTPCAKAEPYSDTRFLNLRRTRQSPASPVSSARNNKVGLDMLDSVCGAYRSLEYRLSDNECAYLCGSLCKYVSIRLGCRVLNISHMLVGAGSDTVSPTHADPVPTLTSDGDIVCKRHQCHHYGRSSLPGSSEEGPGRIRPGRRSRST